MKQTQLEFLRKRKDQEFICVLNEMIAIIDDILSKIRVRDIQTNGSGSAAINQKADGAGNAGP